MPPPPSHFVEYALPPNGGIPPGAPEGVTLGPNGKIWFTDKLNSKVGEITTSGAITEFTPAGAPVEGSIAVGSDGNLWFTVRGNPFAGENASIGRITPVGAISLFPIPAPRPQNSTAWSIVAGPDRNLWFAASICTQGGGRPGWPGCGATSPIIGRITTSGTITEFQIASAANTIAAGPDGDIWFTESNAIGRMTTRGTLVNEFPIVTPPDSNMYVFGGIVAGPDHNLWFTEADEGLNSPQAVLSGNENIYRITTSGTMTAFLIPKRATVLVGDMSIAAGDGKLWFTDSLHNAIGSITTSGTITEFPIPTPSSQPAGITQGPNGTLWFTEGNAGKIGRFTP